MSIDTAQPDWPAAVHAYLARTHGTPVDIQPLRGLSGASVWRVCVMLKSSPRMHETRFYTTVAPDLRAGGVAIPALEWTDIIDGIFWMLLEYIPTPLPHARWSADRAVVLTLQRLHHRSVGRVPPLSDLFRPAWTNAMTAHVCSYLSTEDAAQCCSVLQMLQNTSQHLFDAYCWISGDPNPANWGIRDNGAVVLFDWERFGVGTPALDLAITIPGLADAVTFQTVATRYLEPSAADSCFSGWTAAGFARDIALAKVWNVVEFIDMCWRGSVTDTSVLDRILPRLPTWLHETSAFVGAG